MLPTTPRSRRRALAGIFAAIVAGGLVAAQSRINGELAVELHDSTLAALISFGSGLLILTLIVPFVPTARAGFRTLRTEVTSRRLPWWYLTGGAFGAFFVLTQGLAATALGVALFTVAVVASQTISSAVIDRVGIGSLQKRPVTVLRVAASALAVGAVIFSGLADLRLDGPFLLVFLPLSAGFGIGWQQAINGHVRHVTRSPLTATYVNFIVGTSVLAIAAISYGFASGWQHTFPTDPTLYIGGAIGVIFIVVAAVLVPITGVLFFALGSIAGQLIGALALEILLPTDSDGVAPTTVIGVVLTLIAVAIASLSSQRPPKTLLSN
ncbi:DMT family transporter [Salinibacterium sp. UTAS2018]|uniref:DMT family transporter n=1 Tax=unclassified Salinibacterium TaxID=2632331 RepID=UPI0010093E55|nr:MULTISPECIES: DMT family transporter [unclassified Salinibacterium]MBH0008655.1 DMT family transporter [Salinibacterium sp. SWN1162]QAV70078.1 DMT family transporter [Salinibacterium sp. UTAS2018]